jgi:hypothetical protein
MRSNDKQLPPHIRLLQALSGLLNLAFVAVGRERSFTKVAAKLAVSQSTLIHHQRNASGLATSRRKIRRDSRWRRIGGQVENCKIGRK